MIKPKSDDGPSADLAFEGDSTRVWTAAGKPFTKLRIAARCANALLLGSLLRSGAAAADDTDWFAFNPPTDTFAESPIDLRFLNEKFAGEHGLITTRGDEFIHGASREPVRFWAVI